MIIITNLLTNMVILTWSVSIPTNTPAFQDYALRAMVTNAQFIASEWHLDQAAFTTNKVTEFSASPGAGGVTGAINFGSRYAFGYISGRLHGFSDHAEDDWVMYSDDTKKRKALSKRWATATNRLSRAQAGQIAAASLEAIGLSLDALKPGKAPLITQSYFDESADQLYGPYYHVEWKSKQGALVIRVGVSGITGKIAHFENNSSFLRMSKPSNYLEMLGFPTNTVFVYKRPGSAGHPQEYQIVEP